MMNNNETESEYIGWAVRSVEPPYVDATFDVIGWETISHCTRMKEITVKVSDKRMHRFNNAASVISASIINGNQSFSIVSKISTDYIKQIVIVLYIYNILYNSLLISERPWSTAEHE